MQRRKPIRKVNGKRKRASDKRNFGEEAERVRAMPCPLASVGWHKMALRAREPQPIVLDMEPCSDTGVQAAHVIARGMGAVKGGRFDLVPLCSAHHREAGEAGTSQRAAFEQRYGLDLRDEAD